jgi:hypothetical protein
MTRLRAFLLFLYDFVVGDDWRIAVGVVLALAVTALIAGAGATAWWLLPVAVVAMLSYSIWRAARAAVK